MKLRGKIMALSVVPVVVLGIITFVVSSMQIESSINKEAYDGMHATTLAVKNIFENGRSGDYRLDDKGELWKGDSLNISEAEQIADEIKQTTEMDVTVFFGDTRYLTSLCDEDGNRQIGTKASEQVIETVLNQGKDFYNNNTSIFGKRYIVYYIPYYQEGDTTTPVGMIFLGRDYSEIQRTIMGAQLQLMGIVLIILLFAVLVSVFMVMKITKALKEGIKIVNHISEGNLGDKINPHILKRKDEIGDMGRSIGALDNKLQQVIGTIKKNSEELEQASKDLDATSTEVAMAIGQVDQTVQQIADSTVSQAEDAQKAGENVNIMGEMVEDTSQEVIKLNDTTEKMGQASEAVKEILKELNQSMEEVARSTQQIYEQTNLTNESVQKIGEVTKMITSIASQTNMLSLNASIEAARAGEQGRGFSVVASEIQQLANQSNHSAVTIQEMLAELNETSDMAVSKMQEVKEIIERQGEKITETGNNFQTVQEGIVLSVDGIHNIKKKTKTLDEARVGTVSIVNNVAAIAQENAASTQQTAACIEQTDSLVNNLAEHAEDLKKLAVQLTQSVDIFKIK